MKKSIAAICVLFCLSLAAFAGGNQDSTQGSGDDLSKHVVIRYMTTGNKPTNGATEKVLEQLNAILEEKVNASLEIYYIEWTDYLTKYNLTLAQMDGTVDLVGTATDWLDAWPNSKNGAFLELSEDMLKTYAPQTYASVPADHWEMCKYEGNIYLIPENNYAQWINHGFMYRMDWAREAGLTNGVHSWEDLTKYFAAVKKNHPDVIPWNAQADQSLVTQLSAGYIYSKSDFIIIDGLEVPLFGADNDNLYTVRSPFYQGRELVDFAKLMKQWDSMGVWKTDVLNNTSENREELYLGQVSADQHHTQTWYTTVRPTMDEKQPGSDVEFFFFGEESDNLVAMSITHGAMAVSAGSRNPERALMVFDLLRNDPECYNLFNYGIEGVQYEILPNGMRQRPASYVREQDEITTNFWWGRNDDLEIRDSRAAWTQYDQMVEKYNSIKIDYPYGQIVWDTDPVSAEMANLSDVYTNYMTRIVYGKFDDAEKFIAEYRAALKNAGI